jgi:hypothetical protein
MPDQPPTDEFMEPGSRSADLDPTSVLNEDSALAQLKDGNLADQVLDEITRNATLMKSRKVHQAVAGHRRTPRRVALRLIRELYTFELMKFALTPTLAADLKRIADDLLISRLAGVTLGERITLARRSAERVAGALLLDKEARVWQAALENPRLTESALIRALRRTGASPRFVEAVSYHAKWAVRSEVQIALLGNPQTPLSQALKFSRRVPPRQLRDILHVSRLPDSAKAYFYRDLEKRGSRPELAEKRDRCF